MSMTEPRTGKQQFEALFRKVHRDAFHNGLEELKKEGIIRQDSELLTAINTSRSAFRRFIRGCHYGFDRAQKEIANTVAEYEIQVKQLTAELKDARRKRSKEMECNTLNLQMPSLHISSSKSLGCLEGCRLRMKSIE